MTVKRMDNVGIVVEDIDAAIEFFTELGLELEGRAPIEGGWADGVTGLHDMRVEIAMMRTPDGHSRLEMSRFLAPPVIADHRSAPVNALGYLRVMFTVEDLGMRVKSLFLTHLSRRSQPAEKVIFIGTSKAVMLKILKLSIIICLISCTFSCAKKEEVRDNVFRGIYQGANQEQEMKRTDDPSLVQEDRPLTYDQYKKEREKILQTHDEDDELQQ